MHLDMRDQAAVEKRLWDELEDAKSGMLGAPGADAGFHPMQGFAEPESGRIWFFTSRETDLAKAARDGVDAMFIVLSRDQAFQTCIRGRLSPSLDALHLDKFWGPTVSAWFPKGKEDPDLELLCLTCADADVWVSISGGLKFGWEIAKANLTGAAPDISGHARLALDSRV